MEQYGPAGGNSELDAFTCQMVSGGMVHSGPRYFQHVDDYNDPG